MSFHPDRFATVCLGVGCAIAYFVVGLLFVSGPLPAQDDLAFQTDVKRVVTDLARPRGEHRRALAHPLFVLMLNPAGSLLKGVVGPSRIAALVLTALAGGASVAGFRALLRAAGTQAAVATLWSLVYASSSSQIFFSSVPETFAFSALSLLVVFWLVARGTRSLKAFVAAGVVAAGVTITNLGAAVIAVVFAMRGSSGWTRFRRGAGAATLIGAIVIALVGLQSSLYEERKAASLKSSLSEVRRVLSAERARFHYAASAAGIGGLFIDLPANFLLFNLAAPRLAVTRDRQGLPVTSFQAASVGAMRPAGWIHAVLWGALVGVATLSLAQRRPCGPVVITLAAWFVLNVCIHASWGEPYFLYSCQWTASLLALVALSIRAIVTAPGSIWERTTIWILAAVVIVQVANNVSFLSDLRSLYS